METIHYKIEVFEGPMELLLHLITKHKLNIYDIPIIELVEQYTSYIKTLQALDLEVASEFLEMAARLVHIKTLSLLPRHDEGEQLKKELSGELIEFAQLKQVAKTLSTQTDGFNVFTRPPEPIQSDMSYKRVHDPLELLSAYMRAVGKKLKNVPPSFEIFKPLVTKKIVSVSGKIKSIVSELVIGKKKSFQELLKECTARSDLVAAFLAILELAKTNHIRLDGEGSNVTVELLKVPEGELDFE